MKLAQHRHATEIEKQKQNINENCVPSFDRVISDGSRQVSNNATQQKFCICVSSRRFLLFFSSCSSFCCCFTVCELVNIYLLRVYFSVVILHAVCKMYIIQLNIKDKLQDDCFLWNCICSRKENGTFALLLHKA